LDNAKSRLWDRHLPEVLKETRIEELAKKLDQALPSSD
jgi:hypothetical protein